MSLNYQFYINIFSLYSTQEICPIDGEPITKEQVFKDKCKYLEIVKLQCYCTNKDHGCSWEGRVGDVEVNILRYS